MFPSGRWKIAGCLLDVTKLRDVLRIVEGDSATERDVRAF
jgi:hypothetical protein